MDTTELLKDLIKKAKEWEYLRATENPSTFLELIDMIYSNGYSDGCYNTTRTHQKNDDM